MPSTPPFSRSRCVVPAPLYPAVICLQEGFEGQMNENNIEIGVADASGFRRLDVWMCVPAQACAHPRQPAVVKDYLAAIAS